MSVCLRKIRQAGCTNLFSLCAAVSLASKAHAGLQRSFAALRDGVGRAASSLLQFSRGSNEGAMAMECDARFA